MIVTGTYRTTELGLTAGQLRDICEQIVRVIGAEKYNRWAVSLPCDVPFDLNAECKLLEVMGRATRAEDREHFDALTEEHWRQQAEAKSIALGIMP